MRSIRRCVLYIPGFVFLLDFFVSCLLLTGPLFVYYLFGSIQHCRSRPLCFSYYFFLGDIQFFMHPSTSQIYHHCDSWDWGRRLQGEIGRDVGGNRY